MAPEKDAPQKKVLVPVHVVADSLKKPDEWLDIVAGDNTFELLSIRQLYMKLAEDSSQGIFLLEHLLEGESTDKAVRERIMRLLREKGWALYSSCVMELIKLIQEYLGPHKNEKEDLKNAVREKRWQWGLRHPRSPYVWNSACPWGDCPP